MEAAFQDLSLPGDAHFVFGVARLDQQLPLLLPVTGGQAGVEGDPGDDGGSDGVRRDLDGTELNVEIVRDGGRHHAGHRQGGPAGVDQEELQGLRAAVRGDQAEVDHLLGTVEAGLGGDLHLQRQVQELSASGVGLDPEIISIFNVALIII